MNNLAEDQDLEFIVTLIISWWEQNKRELPWRDPVSQSALDVGVQSGHGKGKHLANSLGNNASISRRPDSYTVWVSEVMLQQTQIKTVIPYYQRWMERFPSLSHLASSSLDDVLKCWEGLGYYGRARNLHRTAVIVATEYGGDLPEKMAQLQNLPGIGRYTAGAIASIAFGQQVAAVDGNVMRTVSRLVDYPEDITRGESKNFIWSAVEPLVPWDRPGDFNQALMELGQQICLVRAPLCHECPLSDYCLAHQRGTQLERPVRPKRKKIPHYQVAAAVVRRSDGQILITRRPLDGLLGGLWEFPGGKIESGESLVEGLKREIKEECAVTISVDRKLVVIKHAYTHFRITLHAFLANNQSGHVQHIGVADHAWVTLDNIDTYAFAKTDLKIIDELKRLK